MFLLTLASNLEIFALGVITKTGPDFFSLFGSGKDAVTLSEVEARWPEIAQGSLAISRKLANSYLTEHSQISLVTRISMFLDNHFRVSEDLKTSAFFLVVVAIFKAISLFSQRYFTQLLAIRVSRDLRQQYFEHIQSLSMNFYQQHNIGSLSSRVVGDAGQIASSINSCLTNFFQTPFTLVTTLCMCFYLSWQLSLVIFIGFPLIVLPIIFLAKRVKRVTRQLQVNQEKFASVLIDFLTGVQTVKMFAMELFSLKKYKEQNDRMAVLEAKTAKYGLLTRPILHAITTACLAIVVIFGLYTLKMTISELLVFCGLLQLVYEPIKKFAEENNNIFRGIAAAERMDEVLQQRSLIFDMPDAMDLKDFKEGIEFRHIFFRYKDEWVLKDLSFKVKKGEMVALVGPTGAGKSSIVQLLPRLYDIASGEILIDGIPLQRYKIRSLRDQIAFVPQKPFLFLDSIYKNIAFGRSFSREEVMHAAKRAHADEFIQELPTAYDFMLAESGKNLSGGQQQRLAIARALVKKAPILVLDEATSSLDAMSEAKIKEAMTELRGEVTQIVIAHRLSTIEHADHIIYLERGEKVAEGTKDELIATCPAFRHMWELMQLGAVVRFDPSLISSFMD